MKALFYTLLALNLLIGLWLWSNGPADMLREPGRIDRQVLPEQFRTLGEAEVEALRAQAEKAAQAQKAAQAEKAVQAANPPPVAAAAPELPLGDCVLVVNFVTESIALKVRARLGKMGLSEAQSALEPDGQKFRLRVSGIRPQDENRLQGLLKEYPSLQLEHCIGPAAR